MAAFPAISIRVPANSLLRQLNTADSIDLMTNINRFFAGNELPRIIFAYNNAIPPVLPALLAQFNQLACLLQFLAHMRRIHRSLNEEVVAMNPAWIARITAWHAFFSNNTFVNGNLRHYPIFIRTLNRVILWVSNANNAGSSLRLSDLTLAVAEGIRWELRGGNIHANVRDQRSPTQQRARLFFESLRVGRIIDLSSPFAPNAVPTTFLPSPTAAANIDLQVYAAQFGVVL
jgi:hypothetical protein